MIRFIYSFFFAFLLLCHPTYAAQYMTGKEISAMISGHSMTFSGRRGIAKFDGAGRWEKNGAFAGYTHLWDKTFDWKGTWYVQNDQYCRMIAPPIYKPSPRCYRAVKINAHTISFIKPNGSVSSTAVIR